MTFYADAAAAVCATKILQYFGEKVGKAVLRQLLGLSWRARRSAT